MLELPGLTALPEGHAAVLAKPLGTSFVVTGPPGTGKSVMAIYRASMLHRSGRRTVLLMYGHMLSSYAKEAVATTGISGIVSTYHSWLSRFWKRCYNERPPEVSRWVFDWHACITKIMALPPPESERTHIVVDEGQDMPMEFYLLLSLIGDSLTIFADQNQRITKEQSTIQEILAATRIKDVLTLQVNYRNTREIAMFAATFYTGLPSGVPDLPEVHGERPFLLKFPKLHLCIAYISQYENEHPFASIGIMLQLTDSATSFYNRLENKVKNPVQIYLSGTRGPGTKRRREIEFSTPGIKILTYASAKGLEFDTVFLPELQAVNGDPRGDELRMRFYVMTSRAKRVLGLMYTGESTPKFVEELPMNLLDDRRTAV
jgi:superfamily I DNA/RNA helicase